MVVQTISPGTKIGFAGLGQMGFGMATNLLRAGYDVLGYDPWPLACKAFVDAGGLVADSIRGSAAGRSCYLIMVATPQQVDSLIFGPEGLASNLLQNIILCVCSTVPPSFIRSVALRLNKIGRSDIQLIDSPVSGGVVGATSGRLTILTSGNDASIAEAKPVLERISAPGRLINIPGGLGASSTLKMLNQHLAGTHVVVTAETLAFAACLGLSTKQAYEIVKQSPGHSWIFGDRGIHMIEKDWTPKSAIDIFIKDLGIVNDAADRLAFPSLIASQSLQAFLLASAHGRSRLDDAGVVLNWEDAIGKSIADCVIVQSPKSATYLNSTIPTTLKLSIQVNAPSTQSTRLGAALESSSNKSSTAAASLIFYYPDHDDAKGIAKYLASLPQHTIVAIGNFNNNSEALAFEQSANLMRPDLTIIDIRVYSFRASTSLILLASATNLHDLDAIIPSLPATVTLLPINGPIGSATSMYFVIRLASLICIAAAAECLSLAIAEHVPTQLVYDIIAGAAGSSEQFERYGPDILAGRFEAQDETVDTFKQALEDFIILKHVAKTVKCPTPLLDAAHQVFKGASRKCDVATPSVAAVVNFWR